MSTRIRLTSGTGILRISWLSTIAAIDALAPFPVAVVLTMSDNRIPVFHLEEFQLHAPFQCQNYRTYKTSLCLHNAIQHAKSLSGVN